MNRAVTEDAIPESAPPASGRPRAAHLGPERRRPLVLDAALRLFVEHGYRGTSMAAVAEAAGVTKPVVYACFPSKEELFSALLDREERRLLEALVSALPREPDFRNLERLLSDTFVAFLQAASAAPDSWRVVLDAGRGSEPELARRVARAREQVTARLSQLIEAYLATLGAEEAPRKAPVLAELLVSLGEASGRALLESDGEWEPDELGRLVARVMVHGTKAA
jgi:AcrR family transcriptional regulator